MDECDLVFEGASDETDTGLVVFLLGGQPSHACKETF